MIENTKAAVTEISSESAENQNLQKNSSPEKKPRNERNILGSVLICLIGIVGVILIIGIFRIVNDNPLKNLLSIDELADTEEFIAFAPSGENEEASVIVEIIPVEVRILEVFQIVSLEIASKNMTMLEIASAAWHNPGTVTLVLEFDSYVQFGVKDPGTIEMNRAGDVLYVNPESIQIDIITSRVSNFERVKEVHSNILTRHDASVRDQVFAAQTEHEQIMAERFATEQNFESARRSFMTSLEAIAQGMGLMVEWVK